MKPKKRINIIPGIIIGLVIGLVIYYFTKKPINSAVSIFLFLGIFIVYKSTRNKLIESQRIKIMEFVFPDFLQLVASNLKAGITIDKALVISSRKEFAPLDEEINQLGRDLVTGKQIAIAMKEMTQWIKSEKISKTVNLIITGMKSGGNLATLLEQTSISMRERQYVEKRAASNVLMYVILIFFAIGVGAPALFSLSTVLVEVLTKILSNVPEMETTTSLPFALTSISISSTFITYFAIIFLLTIVILGSMVTGLVQKGEEREGLKYAIPLGAISLVLFFVIKIFLLGYFQELIG